MAGINRRELGAGFAAATATLPLGSFAIAQARPRIVVIGGGPGGATVASTLARAAGNLDITLIEAERAYTTCFFSNLTLGGFRSRDSIRHGYDGVSRLGVKVVHERASAIDTTARTVRTDGGATFAYDRLVVAPGIAFKFGAIEGLTPAVSAQEMPHAYSGATQIDVLARQLDAMRDGGTVVIAPPRNPYRCPPGPYERACLIAHYLKTRKPKSKLVIIDPKNAFSKQELFVEAFKRYYDGIVELNLTNEIDDYALAKVDAKAMTLTTKAGETYTADLANVIPDQRAGEIAIAAGLADGDWCPVDPETFRSRKAQDVYVLGDAAVATEMPKSAYAANSQAKVVAGDILAVLAGKPKSSPAFRNTCWSMLAPDDSVKLGADYVPKSGRLEAAAPFISKAGEGAAQRLANYEESTGWYATIVEDVFANGVAPAAGKRG